MLPAGFDEALFEPRGSGGLLHLRLVAAEVPQHFKIHAPSGQLVLSSASWDRSSGIVVQHEIDRRLVAWMCNGSLPDGAWVSAVWVVNVTELGLLPPPSELAQLSLEDLIAILTSARPIHWLLAERLAAREDSGMATNIEAIDPHQKVDTSRFLMRRTCARWRARWKVCDIDSNRPPRPMVFAGAYRDRSDRWLLPKRSFQKGKLARHSSLPRSLAPCAGLAAIDHFSG